MQALRTRLIQVQRYRHVPTPSVSLGQRRDCAPTISGDPFPSGNLANIRGKALVVVAEVLGRHE